MDWPSEMVERLNREARQKGLSLDDDILHSIVPQKALDGVTIPDETAQRHAWEAAGRSIRELRKGNRLGTDLTVRDLIEEGRRF